MAQSKRNSLRKSGIREDRNQREIEPVQPGATAQAAKGAPPGQARKAARNTFGKTSKHTSAVE